VYCYPNHQKPTNVMDALSVSPFLVINDNILKAYIRFDK
jgi:hypothetical protein